MYKKGSYIAARIVALIFMAIMACLFAVQTPFIQTKLSEKAIEKFSTELAGKIQCDSLSILPSGALMLRGVSIIDSDPVIENTSCPRPAVDTLFYAKQITATFTIGSILDGRGLHFGKVAVDEALLHITSERNDYHCNINRIFKIVPQPVRPAPGPDVFDIRKVTARNFRFRLTNYIDTLPKNLHSIPIARQFESSLRYISKEDGSIAKPIDYIDYSNLELIANIDARSMRYTGGRMYGVLQTAQAIEKSGYYFSDLSGRAAVGQGKAMIERIHLVDPWSDLRFKYYSMTWDNLRNFAHYISEILMEGELSKGRMNEASLRAYSRARFGCDYDLDIESGYFRGYVNDFRVDKVRFTEAKSGLRCEVSGTMTGLPDIQSSVIDADIQSDNLSRSSLNSILRRFAHLNSDLDFLAAKPRMQLSARLRGPFNQLKLSAQLRHKQSKLQSNSTIGNLLNSRDIQISTSLQTSQFSISELLPSIPIDKLDLYTSARATLSKSSPLIELDSLYISNLHYKGQDYCNLNANARYSGSTLVLEAKSSDPKLCFDIDATAQDLSSNAQIELNANMCNADLYSLGLDTREIGSSLRFHLDAKLAMLGQFISGDASIRDLAFYDLTSERKIEDSYFSAAYKDEEQIFTIQSPFLNAELSGTASIDQFISELKGVSLQRELPALFNEEAPEFKRNRYKMDIYCRDSRNLLSFLMPGLYIADSTIIRLNLDERARLNASLYSPRIAIGNSYIKDVKFQIDNHERALNAQLTGSEIRSSGLDMQNPLLLAFAQNDLFGVSLNFKSLGESFDDGEILVDGAFSRNEEGELKIEAYPLDSYINSSYGTWSLDKSELSIVDNCITVNDLRIRNGEQSLSIDGKLSPHISDTLDVQLANLDLSIIDNFLNKKLGISGKANGQALLRSGNDKMLTEMQSHLSLDSLDINGIDAGNLWIAGSLNSESDDINLLVKQNIADQTTLYAEGMFYPKEDRLYLDLELEELPANLALPFAKDIFSDISGSVSGEVLVQGALDQLALSSNGLALNDARLKLIYTGVPYMLTGPLRLDNRGLHFDNLSLSDNAQGSGQLWGSLLFEHLGNFRLDAHTSFEGLKVLDNQDLSQPIRGYLRAGGNADVTGAFSAIHINAQVSTFGTGQLYIPTSSNLTGSTSNLLSFTQVSKKLDPYEEMLLELKTQDKAKSQININASVNISSEVKAYLESTNGTGNLASLSGDGSLALVLQPAKDIFDLNGDYIISEGDFNFNLPGILSRSFSIVRGSSLRFGGGIENTDINLNALYKLKTSLSTLIADASTVASRRQVECGIKISDRLSNPSVDFSIDIPDLDPTTKTQIEGILSTSDKVQRQFLALLVMGSFIPDESSGVFNGSNVLLSNATELMSNQLNTIFQKLEIPVDVGIGYQTATGGNDIFDVAISTRLFNDRVLVGGSVGNRNYGSSSDDVVGDLDIQIKLDRRGRYRFTLFSHSVDEFSSYLDLSQRNGIGVNFQRGYKSLKEIFGGKDSKEEMVSISIEEESKEKDD